MRYGVKTKLSAEEVIEKAVEFFGTGLGLDVVNQESCTATFEGGGGHVTVTVDPGCDPTEVELETREWDYDVRNFMRKIS